MATSLAKIIESFTPKERREIEAHVERRIRAYKRLDGQGNTRSSTRPGSGA